MRRRHLRSRRSMVASRRRSCATVTHPSSTAARVGVAGVRARQSGVVADRRARRGGCGGGNRVDTAADAHLPRHVLRAGPTGVDQPVRGDAAARSAGQHQQREAGGVVVGGGGARRQVPRQPGDARRAAPACECGRAAQLPGTRDPLLGPDPADGAAGRQLLRQGVHRLPQGGDRPAGRRQQGDAPEAGGDALRPDPEARLDHDLAGRLPVGEDRCVRAEEHLPAAHQQPQ